MDAGTRERGGRAGHWGLAGMRERADALGGTLRISSAGGVGTGVELTIPLGTTESASWRQRLSALCGRRYAREQQS
jgi:nitrate/nitrite-specific signal transduction histidine kinase